MRCRTVYRDGTVYLTGDFIASEVTVDGCTVGPTTDDRQGPGRTMEHPCAW